MDDAEIVAEYRNLLTKTEQESQSDFDKAILTLSGGALGISVALTRDFIGTSKATAVAVLICAWAAWSLSSTAVLVSFYTSTLALRKAIKQLDAGRLGMERPGGWYDFGTTSLNLIGLVLFVAGLVLIIIFFSYNLRFK